MRPTWALRWEVWRARDRAWARRFNRGAERMPIVRLARIASWLGDGPLWFGVLAALYAFGDAHGRDCAWQLTIAGAVDLFLYYTLKRNLGRPRPYEACDDIRLCGRPLDRFSFPSGHALHASACMVILAAHVPVLAIGLAPVAVMIVVSRLVLGLHYPSDVVAGLAIGAAVAGSVVSIGATFGA